MIALSLLAALTPPGAAQDYSFPTHPDDYGAFYVTAYRDDGGQDWDCRQGHYAGHTGTDFGCGSWACMDVGRPATAAADGVVIAAADGEFDRCTTADCGTGNYVKLEHADGRETWYWHLKQWSVVVAVGDTVRCGDKLGEIGSSGNSLGPHLHFGATNTRGAHVDPFEGPCSASATAWVDQGPYDGLPALTCAGQAYVTDAMAFAALHAATSTDLDGDGRADAVTHGPAGWRWSPGPPDAPGAARALPWGPAPADDPLRWARWRAADVDGDGLTDLCERGLTGLTCFTAASDFRDARPGPAWSDADGLGADRYAATLRAGDLNGDGRDDLCLRGPEGVRCALATADGFDPPWAGPELSDDLSWDDVDNYGTLLLGDLDGDGGADLCARANVGVRCYRYRDGAFGGSIAGPAWGEDEGFAAATHWSSITLDDVDGDGRADLCARTAEGWDCHLATDDGFGEARAGPRWSDDTGWNDPSNAWTFRLGDVDGDGDLDLCARANAGVRCARWDGAAHTDRFDGPAWSDEAGWATLERARSMRLADVTGDGRADLCGRDAGGLVCHPSTGDGFGPAVRWEGTADADGGLLLAGPACGDGDGDGRADCRPAPAAPPPPPESPDTGAGGDAPDPEAGVSLFPGRVCGCDTSPSAPAGAALAAWAMALVARARRRSPCS
jgi:murein DD-endopeptidase MepM/ murein hydrolase activator NlpD